jgi:hypothetical protein
MPGAQHAIIKTIDVQSEAGAKSTSMQRRRHPERLNVNDPNDQQ